MQDPSTPNPSESENSASGSGKPPKQPLKLKPIDQPKPDPEATEENDTPPPENAVDRPVPTDPRAVPTDPAPTAESRLDERRKNLKLRRIIIKDVEINPHINPDAEPVPEAQPFEEPEEPPPPADLKAVMEAPRPDGAESMPPSPENNPLPVEEPPPQEAAAEAETTEPVGAEPATPEKSAPTGESEATKISPVRKVIAGMAFLGVLGILILLGIAFFNPFGNDLTPIQPNRIPLAVQKSGPAESEAPGESVTNLSGVPIEASQPDLEAYLSRLRTHRLIASDNPKGVFIDSVFVPEGAVLDARTGLTLSSLSTTSNGIVMLLTPSEGPSVSIPLSIGK
jgi:hypothetical protein